MENPFGKSNRVNSGSAKAPFRAIEFTLSVPSALGLTVQQHVISEQLSEINAERFQALYDSYKGRLYDSWKLFGAGISFDKWLSKQWDESRKRFKL
jgi:hypothetical protein